MPDAQTCEQARLSRDPRFDGLFFTAVVTTRIYCRSVCPVATVRNEHVRYFSSAAAAENAGFRPCLRCRPERAPGAWRQGDAALERALRLIDEGFLAEHSLAALAEAVGKCERHLRRLFVDRLGASPHRVHATRRLLFAKHLLTDTALPITQVALEAGFGSLRRFNASFNKVYKVAPRQLRRATADADESTLTLRLDYRPPYDFSALLESFRENAIPGVEVVTASHYARTFGSPVSPGWLTVGAWPRGKDALKLTLYSPRVGRVLDVVNRTRRMFDLDADPQVIHSTLSRDSRLRRAVERADRLRLPGPWDGCEAAIRAYLRQQHGGNATSILATLIDGIGCSVEAAFPTGLTHLFPPPDTWADTRPDRLARAGLSPAEVNTVQAVSKAKLDGRLDFSVSVPLEEFLAGWTRVTGADPARAHDIAMHALGYPDAFPVRAADCASQSSPHAMLAAAERWRPWRAYALAALRRGNERTTPDR